MEPYEPDFSHLELNRVTSYLVTTHHEFTRDVMEDISSMLKSLLNSNSVDESVKKFHDEWTPFAARMQAHMLEEEEVLFPLIDEIAVSDTPHLALSEARSNGTLNEMIEDHDHHEDDINNIAKLAAAFAPDATGNSELHALFQKIKQLILDLNEHLELETRVLLPRLLEFESKN